GPGSLRQAILDANQMDGDDAIRFAAGVTGTIELNSRLPDLASNIDLEGPGPANLTIEPNPAEGTPEFSILHVAEGARVTLARWTASGGGCSFPGGGGGVQNLGTLTIRGAVFSHNHAEAFGGGAILNQGRLDVLDSTFVENHAGGGGA